MIRLFSVILLLMMAACSGKSEPQNANPKEIAEAGEHAPQFAAISPDNAKASGIETAAAGPAAIRQTLMLYGSIHSNGERQQEIRARYPGVVRVVAKRPGDHVAKGELLLSIESNDSLEPYAIRSPIAGTVLERRVNPGEAIDGTATLLVVADLSTVWGEFAVFARDLAHVHQGQAILIRANEGQPATEARIIYLAPSGSGETQSVVARAVLDNHDKRWVAGQFVTGDVVIDNRQTPVTVVPSALQKMDDASVVFVQTQRGFEPRKVEIGESDGEAVEIKKGLAGGEHYVAKNSYLIKAELLKGVGEEE